MDLDELFPADGCRLPARDEAIAAATALGMRLPRDYVTFLRHTDGFNGSLRGDERCYLRLFPIAEVVARTGGSDIVVDFLPGRVLIGDTGGSWAFALVTDPDGVRYEEIGRARPRSCGRWAPPSPPSWTPTSPGAPTDPVAAVAEIVGP